MDSGGLTRGPAGIDPSRPVEEASTPPASWYVRSEFLDIERARVFRRNWLYACRADQVRKPGDFVSGSILGDPYVVVRDGAGRLRAFYNVCRHHAARVAVG